MGYDLETTDGNRVLILNMKRTNSQGHHLLYENIHKIIKSLPIVIKLINTIDTSEKSVAVWSI